MHDKNITINPSIIFYFQKCIVRNNNKTKPNHYIICFVYALLCLVPTVRFTSTVKKWHTANKSYSPFEQRIHYRRFSRLNNWRYIPP